METKHIDDVEIDICTGCAGIFLDDGEFESFTGVDPTTGLLRVSKFVKVLSKLNERATIDELTGVFNRKYFSEFTRSVFENARRGAVTMIGIDIDHFKQFNTKHGHDGGDTVLKSLARLLTSSLRTSRDDYLFRLGGEEFVMVLFNLSPEDSYNTAENIRRLVAAAPIDMGAGEIEHITLSLGVALARPGDDADSLYKRADELLYEAKNSGRNKVVMEREQRR
ncbi:MAG: diguanylate cyclase [Leptospiraceae bacterium]|nr:diguanylate cyclase [Leptospiraceae bacterium]MCP5485741.1 diguanylate cyclase [Spirochaetales bacterium]